MAMGEEGGRAGVRPVRVGVTGHTDLGGETVRLVDAALDELLRRLREDPPGACRPLVGVSCLAPGADYMFADVVLRVGGELEVVLPWADYPDERTCARASAQYRAGISGLMRRAVSVRVAATVKGRAGFAAANTLMLGSVDRLVAVWNGLSSHRIGGTWHAVREARARELPVTVIWPKGSRRGR